MQFQPVASLNQKEELHKYIDLQKYERNNIIKICFKNYTDVYIICTHKTLTI